MAGAPAHSFSSGFLHSRAFDLAAASPLIVVLVLFGAGNAILIVRQWPGAHGVGAALTIANEAATLLFLGLQLGLCLVRRLPMGKSVGIWPRIVALLGANFNFALLLLPRVNLDAAWTIVSSTLVVLGTLSALAALSFLGRSFSILPEARQLVAHGPYRLVRHPLYLTEMIATLGVMLQFRQPWAALVTIAGIGFQIWRMACEEAVLRRAYPAYAEYAQRTARLLPGLY